MCIQPQLKVVVQLDGRFGRVVMKMQLRNSRLLN